MKRRSFNGLFLSPAILEFSLSNSAFSREVPIKKQRSEAVHADLPDEVSLIVAGTGGAGLCAAISAAENGIRDLIVIDKAPIVGGHTITSTGTVAAVWPELQKKQLIEDSPELMFSQIMAIGKNNNAQLVKTLTEQSGSALEWMRTLGVKWRPKVGAIYGCPHIRGFKSLNPKSGYDYVMAPLRKLKEKNVPIYLETSLKDFIIGKDERLESVLIEQNTPEGKLLKQVRAKALVIATGGFTANAELLAKYAPGQTEGMISNFNPLGNLYDGATGDAITIAEKHNIALSHMDSIQCIPNVGGRTILESGWDIFVDPRGKRFVREGCSWQELRKAVQKIPEKYYWVITPQHGEETENIEYKLLTGLLKVVNDYKELAQELNVQLEEIRKTIDRYNRAVTGEVDDEIEIAQNARILPPPPYYVGKEQLGIHSTLGGITINNHSQVLSKSGKPIPGLYACGEVVGGLHGEDKVAGTEMTGNFVFGRIAGREAAEYLLTYKR
ncbi:FAD-dependent oxidoreductase [Turicimonas sp. TL08]